jgi:hypothetical protein
VSKDAQTVSELISRISPILVAAPDRHADLWDLDQVFWEDYPKPWDVERALRSFTAAADAFLPWSDQLVVTLQIWLQQTDVLRVEAPSVSSVTSLDVSSYRPPAVGLVKKSWLVPVYEVYRVPVSHHLVDAVGGQVRAYYECFRTAEAQAANEPYDRIVMFQHWV